MRRKRGHVHCTRAKGPLGADTPPYERRSGESECVWTDEPARLIRRAIIDHVREHPLLCARSDNAENEDGHTLHRKHRPGGDFHVMPKLELPRKCHRLHHRDEKDSLEYHVGDGASGKEVPSHDLGHDIQPNLLVGDGCDHSNGYAEDSANSEGDEGGPYGELCGEYFDGADEEDKGDTAQEAVPPARYFSVGLH